MIIAAVTTAAVVYRVGQKLKGPPQKKIRAKNAPEAAKFIHREYRKGWSL